MDFFQFLPAGQCPFFLWLKGNILTYKLIKRNRALDISKVKASSTCVGAFKKETKSDYWAAYVLGHLRKKLNQIIGRSQLLSVNQYNHSPLQ